MNHSELVWFTDLDCWWQSPDHTTHTGACRFPQFPSRQHIEQFTFQQNWFMFNFVCFRPSNHVYGENYVVARENNQGATLQPQAHHQGYSWPPHHHLGLWQYVAIWSTCGKGKQLLLDKVGCLYFDMLQPNWDFNVGFGFYHVTISGHLVFKSHIQRCRVKDIPVFFFNLTFPGL